MKRILMSVTMALLLAAPLAYGGGLDKPETHGGKGPPSRDNTAIGVGLGVGVGSADADANASSKAHAKADVDANAKAIGVNVNENKNFAAGGDGGDAAALAVGKGGDARAYSEGSSADQAQRQSQSQNTRTDAAANNEGNELSTEVDVDASTDIRYDDYPVMPAPASFAGLCYGGAGVSERDISLSVAQVERYCARLQIADALYAAAATVVVKYPEKPVRAENTCGPMPSASKGDATTADLNLWQDCMREYKAAMADYHAEMDRYESAYMLAESKAEEREFYLNKARETVMEADAWIENMAPVHAISEVSRGLVFPAILVFIILAL